MGPLGHPGIGPLDGCGEERLLHCVLGSIELAEAPDDGAEDSRGKLPQELLEGGCRRHISSPASSISARISTTSYSASGVAISTARSRVSTSTAKMPASC